MNQGATIHSAVKAKGKFSNGIIINPIKNIFKTNCYLFRLSIQMKENAALI
jgi:hypothetical protein